MSVRSGDERIIDHLISLGRNVDQCSRDVADLIEKVVLFAPNDRKCPLLTYLINRFPRLINNPNWFVVRGSQFYPMPQ